MIVDIAYSALGLGILFCAFLAYKMRNDGRPIALPVSEKLATFRVAYARLGVTTNDFGLLQIYNDVLPKFENPYVAAMDCWVDLIHRLSRPGGEAYFGPDGRKSNSVGDSPPEDDPEDDEKTMGLATICEFVLEGHVTPDEGRQYFDKIVEILKKIHAQERRVDQSIANFDSLLDKQRAIARA